MSAPSPILTVVQVVPGAQGRSLRPDAPPTLEAAAWREGEGALRWLAQQL